MYTLTTFAVICGVFMVVTPFSGLMARVIYDQQSSQPAFSYSYRVDRYPVLQPPKMLLYSPAMIDEAPANGVLQIPVVLQLYLNPKPQACPLYINTKNEQTGPTTEVTSLGPEVEEKNPPDDDDDGIANS